MNRLTLHTSRFTLHAVKIGFLMRFEPERIAFARINGCDSAGLLVKPEDPFLPPHSGWRGRAAEVREAYATAGLKVSCIGGMYQNILDPGRTAELGTLVRNCVELAAEMGADSVGCFAGRIVNQPLEQSLPAFKNVWGELARFAADRNVRIAFENCPDGPLHHHEGGANCFCTPEMWERGFEALAADNAGLQWDPSHLVCMQIDVMETLRKFGPKIFNVHAKDARVNRAIVQAHGLRHPDAATHCFPGLGDSDWGQIVSELKRQGYNGALDIEGRHDPVYCGDREDEGLLIAIRHLKQCLPKR